jgi:hypothetical protein
MSILVSLDIVFYRPQIRIPYIMFGKAPLLEKGDGVDDRLYILSPIYFIWYRWCWYKETTIDI